jgi:hypothetical protein
MKRVRNVLLMTFLGLAIAFSLIQLRIPVVKANGCPPGSAVGCGCNLTEAISVESATLRIWYCTYSCGCGGGSGNPMVIEQTLEVQEWL